MRKALKKPSIIGHYNVQMYLAADIFQVWRVIESYYLVQIMKVIFGLLCKAFYTKMYIFVGSLV